MRSFAKNSIIETKIFLKENSLTLTFLTIFTIGTALGAMAPVFSGDKAGAEYSVIASFFAENKSLSVIALFSRNLVGSFLYMCAFYLAGLCAIGIPIILLLPLIKGVALGMIISYQYCFNGLKGFLYTIMIILLPNAFLLLLYHFAFIQAFYMSITVSNGVYNAKPREVKQSISFISFTKRYILLAIGVIAVCLAEGICSSVFSGII